MSKIALTPNASGTGVFTISSPATNTNRTLTLPDITGTLVSTDASGNVGIGTSSPSTKLDVLGGSLIQYQSGATNNTAPTVLTISNKTTGAHAAGLGSSLLFTHYDSGGGYNGPKISSVSNADPFTSNLVFYSHNYSNSEAMRIDSSGSVIFGKTVADINTGGVYFNSPYSYATFCRDQGAALYLNRTGNDGAVAEFSRQGVPVGFITITGSATTYATSSDYRLKTDAQPMTGASARVQALKPVNFEWISSGERVDGFLAHEAQAIVPECVTGTKDAMRDEEYEVTAAVYEDIIIAAVLDEEGNEIEAERTEQRLVTEAVMGTRSVPDMQGIDQSKLVPLLTAALQEALTEISALKVRVAALEAV